MNRMLFGTFLTLSIALPSVAFAHEPDEDDDEYEEYEEVEVVEVERVTRPREERPSTGTGFLIPGGILTGLGVLNLATAPLCKTDLVHKKSQDECLIASLTVGGVMLAVGLPLLIVGGVKRSAFVEWQQKRRKLPIVSFAPFEDGGLFTVGDTF